MYVKVLTLVTAIVCIGNIANAAPKNKDDGLTLNIIHTNDMHARFEETSQYSGICSEKAAAESKCYGGFARIATLIRQARNSSTPDKPTFFLNAGDTYQGTKLYSYYKWKIVTHFLNILKPDAASLGNHEFDDGVPGLLPYLNKADFPIVTSNLDLKNVPELYYTKRLVNSTILKAKNKKIGIIGYLTPDTVSLSQPGKVKFFDEIVTVKREAKILTSQGCDIIIALGHSGYEMDMKIAREVEEVDLVVGGHTNTFLWNGPAPDIEEPQGAYPTVVKQPSGRKVYVVQAYAYTKYLGNLTVEFDGKGEVVNIFGKPILVDNSIPKAQDIEDDIKKWLIPLNNMTSQVVGFTKVLLQGDERVCRMEECNFGNLVVDAMVHYGAKQFEGDNGWTETAIAIHQAGGLRSSVSPMDDDKVTMDDILNALPFGAYMYKIYMTGRTLIEVLEWSVHDRIDLNTTNHGGCFLQVSGLKVSYDLTRPVKSRVVDVKARCSLCIIPTYEPINLDATYPVLIPDFLYRGGDGYNMLKDLKFKNMNVTVAQIVADYINQTSPVYPAVEGRSVFVQSEKQIVTTEAVKTATTTEAGRSTNNSAVNFSQQIPTYLMIVNCLVLMRILYFYN